MQGNQRKAYLKTSRKVILCAWSNEFIKLNEFELRSDGLLWSFGLACALFRLEKKEYCKICTNLLDLVMY